MPMCRILPSRCRSLSAPIDSAKGTAGSGGVQLVEVDAVESKPVQRRFAGGAKVVGAPVRRPAGQLSCGRPAAGACAFVAAFGSDEQAVVGREGFGDEFLRNARTVGVGRVDQLDTQLDGPA